MGSNISRIQVKQDWKEKKLMESLLVYKHKLQAISVFKFWRFPDKKEMAHEEKKVRFSSTVNGNPLHKEFFV